MIALLRGTVRAKSQNVLVIDAGGVGYEVFSSQETIDRSPQVGETYEVFTRLIVREDSMTLFGFFDVEERALFDQVIAVSGIGPKTGLSILALGSAQLKEAIRSTNVHALTNIPGVGKKTAERLIVELRDKLLKEEVTQTFVTSSGDAAGARMDALQALMALGYPRAIAEKAIRSVLQTNPESGRSTEQLVKAALKQAINS